MGEILALIVQWIVVPFVMVALLIFDIAIVQAAKEKSTELRLSTRAGLWAGFLVFVIYVVTQLGQMRDPNFDFSTIPGLLPIPLIFGIAAGFAFFLLLRVAELPQLVGLIVLALAAATTSALFTYFFLESLRLSLLYITLGTAFGILLHIVVFPTSLKQVFDTEGNPTEMIVELWACSRDSQPSAGFSARSSTVESNTHINSALFT